MKGDRRTFIDFNNSFLTTSSETFQKQSHILTGLKLDITYLSSVFLSIGTTDAILALFGKVKVLILLLMAIDSGSAKMPDANLTSLVGILSIPGAFSEISGWYIFP